MNKWIVSAAAACTVLAGCNKAEAPAPAASVAAVTEADALKAFDDTVAAWGSMDAAKVKALYAPDVAGFDYAGGGLVTDRKTWDANQDAFAAAKLDKINVTAKKVQIVGPDTFIVSSLSEGLSSTMPQNNSTFRCTDLYHRDADGKWWIVNENCSPAVKPG